MGDQWQRPGEMLHWATQLCLGLAILAHTTNAFKFCPRERDGDQCRANSTQFKCGVFFADLTESRPLTWLGALPDALDKVDKKDYEEDYEKILGKKFNRLSFERSDCKDVTVNSRCFAMMSKVINEDMDTCGKNLLTIKAEQTMGDYLCGQVKRWLRRDSAFKADGRDNIGISFAYSACGGPWSTVVSQKPNAEPVPLATKEPLCCDRFGKFKRCDGTAFRSNC